MIMPISNINYPTNSKLLNNSDIKRNNNVSFGKNNEEYKQYLEKFNYLEAKTKNYDDVMTAFLISALFLGAQNIDLSKKLTTIQKIGLACTGVTCAAFLGKVIKKMQLSKKYAREHNIE